MHAQLLASPQGFCVAHTKRPGPGPPDWKMQTSGASSLALQPPQRSVEGVPAAPAAPPFSAPAAPALPAADAPPSPSGGQLRTSQPHPPLSSRRQRPVGPPTLPSAQIVFGRPRAGPHSALGQVKPLEPPPELPPPARPAPPLEPFPAPPDEPPPAPPLLVLAPQATKLPGRASQAASTAEARPNGFMKSPSYCEFQISYCAPRIAFSRQAVCPPNARRWLGFAPKPTNGRRIPIVEEQRDPCTWIRLRDFVADLAVVHAHAGEDLGYALLDACGASL